MSSLEYVHEKNTYRADHVCLSILPHDSTQEPPHRLDEIWYGRYVIGVSPKIIIFNFLQSVTLICRLNKLWGGINTSATYRRVIQLRTHDTYGWKLKLLK
jgi:hypothetical protein